MTIAFEMRRHELGDFLRRRREGLSPEAVGIPARGLRRTPGLRRDEVALRANVSAAYYERLERGARGPFPSPDVLRAIAGALRLNAQQSNYLFRLAGQAAPTTTDGSVDMALTSTVNVVSSVVPAAVVDDLGTVLAQNAIHAELFGRMTSSVPPRSNLMWRWFTEPSFRQRLKPADDHDEAGRQWVAELRAGLAQRCDDARVRAFLDALSQTSEQFRKTWAEQDVLTAQPSRGRLQHERVGTIEFERTMMISPTSFQRVLLLHPAADTDAAERLTRLHEFMA